MVYRELESEFCKVRDRLAEQLKSTDDSATELDQLCTQLQEINESTVQAVRSSEAMSKFPNGITAAEVSERKSQCQVSSPQLFYYRDMCSGSHVVNV